MKFSRMTTIGVLIGFFILAPILRAIMSGSLRWTFNYLIDGIIGILFAIAIGFLFGKIGGSD